MKSLALSLLLATSPALAEPPSQVGEVCPAPTPVSTVDDCKALVAEECQHILCSLPEGELTECHKNTNGWIGDSVLCKLAPQSPALLPLRP